MIGIIVPSLHRTPTSLNVPFYQWNSREEHPHYVMPLKQGVHASETTLVKHLTDTFGFKSKKVLQYCHYYEADDYNRRQEEYTLLSLGARVLAVETC